jgi:hypothetical protein
MPAPAAIQPRTETRLASLRRFAKEQFEGKGYVCFQGVAVFREHETKTEDGKPRKYDRAYLQAIVDRCNRRIAETGDFAALVDGHTPDKDGLPQPEALGFVGPFYLGTLGIEKKCVAIFADEWRAKDRLDRIKRLPRRSVELWDDDDPRNVFIDPVAAISETPRLDLGVQRFGLHPFTGKKAIRYSASAVPAAPGGSNTFLKRTSPDSRKKEHAMDGNASPEIVTACVEAISQTPLWQKMEAFFAKQGGMDDAPADPAAGAAPAPGGDAIEDDDSPIQNAADQGDEEDDDDLIDPAGEGTPAAGMDAGAESDMVEGDDDEDDLAPVPNGAAPDDGMTMPAMPAEGNDPRLDRQPTEETYSVTRRYAKLERYSKRQTEVLNLQGETIRELMVEVGGLRREIEDLNREAIIDDLAKPGRYRFDVDRKKRKCLYSLGSTMSREQFVAEMEEITTGPKNIVGKHLPTVGRTAVDVGDDDPEVHALAMKYANRTANQRKAIPYTQHVAQAREDIRKERGGK